MLYDEEDGSITIALTGDSLITRRVSVFQESRFLDVVELIREADVAFTNAETTFHSYEPPPSLTPGGGYMASPPELASELRWLGFELASCANNHAFDFGEGGLTATKMHLADAGLTNAGTGGTLAEARMPAYLETPKGRVALISASSSGPPGMLAGDQWRDVRGRPGVNVIRSITMQYVSLPIFESLRELNNILRERSTDWLTRTHYSRRPPEVWGDISLEDTDTQFFMTNIQPWSQYSEPPGFMIAVGDSFKQRLLPYKDDVAGNLQRVGEARRMADWVIVAMHDHDEGETPDSPSDVAIKFGKAAIDEGADIFVVHGPHRDRGIELYRGKPLLYGLGHFIFQSDTVRRIPRDNMARAGLGWEATTPDFFDIRAGREHEGEFKGMADEAFRWRNAVATVTFSDGQLDEIRVYPIDLGFRRRRYQRGRPMMAEGETAEEVLDLFVKTCSDLGTEMKIRDGVGVISLQDQPK